MIEGIAVSLVAALQSSSVSGTKLDTPGSDRFIGYRDSALSQQILDEWSGIPAATEAESVVQPDCILDDIWGAPSRGKRWRLYVFILGLWIIGT